MIQIEAIDIFIETDPDGEGEDGPGLISVRVPYDRDFAGQVKELGAKWDDQSKEWRLYGSEELVKQIASLCKTIFPRLPRRRNRLVAAQLSTHEGQSWASEDKAKLQTRQVELVARVEFVVNRTLKNYRVGQALKWVKEFKQIIELPASDEATTTPTATATTSQQEQFALSIRPALPELERVATTAFEALLVGRKDAVKAILNEAGIKQI